MAGDAKHPHDPSLSRITFALAATIGGAMIWAHATGLPVTARMTALEQRLGQLVELERSQLQRLDQVHAQLERLAAAASSRPALNEGIITHAQLERLADAATSRPAPPEAILTPHVAVPSVDVILCICPGLPEHPWCDEHHMVTCHPSHPTHPVGP